jgi:hypothetical protein
LEQFQSEFGFVGFRFEQLITDMHRPTEKITGLVPFVLLGGDDCGMIKQEHSQGRQATQCEETAKPEI